MNAGGPGSLRVLLIGALPPQEPSSANPVGGAAVNFGDMVRQLKLRSMAVNVVDISRPRVNLGVRQIWHNCATVARLMWQVSTRIRQSDVVIMHISAKSVWWLGSGLWLICTALRRPVVLKFIGGDFAKIYDDYSVARRRWANATYMRCASILVQAEAIRRRFHGHENVRWFPNTRDTRRSSVEPREVARRFIFVSQLRMEKGLREAVDACRELPNDCCLNVYGPIMPNTDLSVFEGQDRSVYRGVLRQADVPDALERHDVLVLPTYWKVEGYPGIVLEALQCGRPVISTSWRSVPEVVEDGRSGLLVEPRSTSAVREAIERVIGDPDLYRALCAGARRRGDFFRSGKWYDELAAELLRITGR